MFGVGFYKAAFGNEAHRQPEELVHIYAYIDAYIDSGIVRCAWPG